jgi:hypothetical protein
MITFDDVAHAFPDATHDFTADDAKPFIEAANHGFHDARFVSRAMADRGRINYVMHMLTKPALDLNAPHILAQMGQPRPGIKKPHPWTGTGYGETLKKLVKP